MSTVDNPKQIQLAEITQQQLLAFRGQRFQLKALVAGSRFLVCGLIALAVAIIWDALATAPSTRPMASGLFYFSCILAAYLLGVRPLVGQPVNLRDEARLLEGRSRRVRDLLVPAVELSEQEQPPGTSLAFIDRLQQDAATAIESLVIRDVLPRAPRRRAIRMMQAAGVVSLAVCLIPGLHVPLRAARILLPTLDTGRVSSIAITLLQPLPHDKSIPQGDVVVVKASFSGNWLGQAQLQTRFLSGSQSQPMASRLNEQQAQGTLSTENEWIEYRVVSQNAATAWHRLTANPRPQMTQMQAVIYPPDYASGSPPQRFPTDGNISAIRGSRVELQLTPNVPLAVAQIQWLDNRADEVAATTQQAETAEANTAEANTRTANTGVAGSSTAQDNTAPQTSPKPDSDAPPATIATQDALREQADREIDLRPASGGSLHADFRAWSTARYKLHLVSRASALTNLYAPNLKIEALEDTPPTLAWRLPASTDVICSANQTLQIQLAVQDQLPLKQLQWVSRLNDGPWQPLHAESKLNPEDFVDGAPTPGLWQTRYLVTETLPLWPLELSAGDTLQLALVAEDARQQRVQSRSLQIAIAQSNVRFEPSPTQQAQREIAERVDELGEKLSQYALGPDRRSLRGQEIADGIASDLRQLIGQVQQTAVAATDANDSSSTDESVSTRSVSTGQTLSSLHTLGDSLARLNLLLENQIHALGNVEFDNKSDRGLALELAQHARETGQHYREIISAVTVQNIAASIVELSRDQTQLANEADGGQANIFELARRQQVICSQVRQLQKFVLDEMQHARGESGHRLQQMSALLDSQASLAQREQGSTDLRSLQHNSGLLAATLQRLSLPDGIDPAWRASWKNGLSGLLALSTESGITPAWVGAGPSPAHALDQHVRANANELAIRREMARMGGLGQSQLPSDLGLAQRSLVELLAAPAAPNLALRSRGVSEAINTLYCHATLLSSKRSILNLLSLARRKRAPTDRQSLRWMTLAARLSTLGNVLPQTSLPADVKNGVQQVARTPATSRANDLYTNLSAEADSTQLESLLAIIEQDLTRAEAVLRPHAVAARKLLRSLAPSAIELARRAADSTARVGTLAQDLASAIADEEVINPPQRIDQIAQSVDGLRSPLNELRDALVDIAESQNLLDRRQIETAQRADQGIAMVDQVAQALSTSLSSVDAAAPVRDLASELVQSAQTHQSAAEGLRALAEFLASGSLQDPQASSPDAQPRPDKPAEQPTLDDPNQAEPPLPESPQVDEVRQAQYDQAKQLADFAEHTPQEMLQQLEQELQRSPPMQRELSDIARAAAEYAKQQLEEASQNATGITRQLAKSDPMNTAQAELLGIQLAFVRESTSRLLVTLITEAGRSAEAAGSQDVSQQTAPIQSQLAALIKAITPLPEDATVLELGRIANDAAAELAAIAEATTPQADQLERAAGETHFETELELEQNRRDARDRARRIQQQLARQALQLENFRKQQARTAAKLGQELQRSLLDLQAQLAQQPLPKQHETKLTRRLTLLQSAKTQNDALVALLVENVQQAAELTQAINSQAPFDSPQPNPTAALAAALGRQAEEVASSLASLLGDLDASPNATRFAAEPIATGMIELQTAQAQLARGQASLERAARHEGRLNNLAAREQLQKFAAETEAADTNRFHESGMKLDAALQSAQAAPNAGQATAAASLAAGQATTAASQATAQVAANIGEFLAAATPSAGPPTSASPSSPSTSPPSTSPTNTSSTSPGSPSESASNPPAPSSPGGQGQSPSSSGQPNAPQDSMPIAPQALAELLDELDRQLNHGTELGESEDDSTGVPQTSSRSQTPPQQLSDAAEQIAQALSRGRSPATQQTSGDLATATDSETAEVNPQSPTDVQMLNVDRLDGDWGKLREHSTDDAFESQRSDVPAAYRGQVEAYFRQLGNPSLGPTSNQK